MAQTHPPLKMRPDLVQGLLAIQRENVQGEDARKLLGTLLQAALELEFATIPPYLSAAFSLGGSNQEIQQLVVRAAKEEMLHMTVVGNLMNAIGITPDIIAAAPNYPYNLEMLESDLELNLKSFSLDLVQNLFMQIEAPEDPVDFTLAEPEPETIGQFYQQIINIIQDELIPDLFKDAEQNKFKQITYAMNFRSIAYVDNEDTHKYPLLPEFDLIITDPQSAVNYLNWVVDQGEGADKFEPLTMEGIPAHYYRFESILEGKYLIVDESHEFGFSYSGGDLPFSTEGVIDFADNAKAEDYSAHPDLEEAMIWFNEEYSEMINHLHESFRAVSSEEKDKAYNASLNVMQNMRTSASDIIFEASSAGVKAGMPFQYISGDTIT